MCERNVRADEVAVAQSQLVTRMGQLAARSQISHCGIWIVGIVELARFGFLRIAKAVMALAVNVFSEY